MRLAAVNILVLIALLGCLAACGKKPSDVDPPAGIGKHEYPRTYPDLSTDPEP